MGIDDRKLDQIRAERSELENHYIDEVVAGRLDRRSFLRRGAVLGMSASVMGAVLAACGGANSTGGSASPTSSATSASTSSAATKGGTLKLASAGSGGRDQPADRRRRRRALRPRADRRVPDVRQQHQAPAPADAGDQLEGDPGRQGVDVQAALGRQVPQRPADDRRRRRLHVPAAGRPEERLERAVDVHGRAQARGRRQGRLRNGRVPPRGGQRQLPVHHLLRQLQRDHRPQGHRLRQVGQDDDRHRRVQAPEATPADQSANFVANKTYWGGAPNLDGDRVHVLPVPAAAAPGAAGRRRRRDRPVRADGRAGDPVEREPVQHHQAEVVQPPRAVDAQRPGAVHRRPGPPGDRLLARPPGDGQGAAARATARSATTARSRRVSRRRTRASRSGPRTSPRPSSCCRRPVIRASRSRSPPSSTRRSRSWRP